MNHFRKKAPFKKQLSATYFSVIETGWSCDTCSITTFFNMEEKPQF